MLESPIGVDRHGHITRTADGAWLGVVLRWRGGNHWRVVTPGGRTVVFDEPTLRAAIRRYADEALGVKIP